MSNNNSFTETFYKRSYTQGNTVDIFGEIEHFKKYLAQHFVLQKNIYQGAENIVLF